MFCLSEAILDGFLSATFIQTFTRGRVLLRIFYCIITRATPILDFVECVYILRSGFGGICLVWKRKIWKSTPIFIHKLLNILGEIRAWNGIGLELEEKMGLIICFWYGSIIWEDGNLIFLIFWLSKHRFNFHKSPGHAGWPHGVSDQHP